MIEHEQQIDSPEKKRIFFRSKRFFKTINKVFMRNLVIFALLCAGIEIMAIDLVDKYNLSFENGAPGAGVPRGWSFPLSSTVTVETVRGGAPREPGVQCLAIDYTKAIPADNCRILFSDFIPIDPGRKYIQSFWLKTDGRTAASFGVSVGRSFYDENKKQIWQSNYYGKCWLVRNYGPTDWEYFSAVLSPGTNTVAWGNEEIPPQARYVRITINSSSYNKRYWIDAMRFEPSRISFGCSQPGDSRYVAAAEITTPPVIDGQLDDALWSNPDGWQSNFVRTVCPAEKAIVVSNQTRFKVAKDKTAIYLAFQCYTSSPDAIKTSEHARNDLAVFADDDIEVFIDASGQRKNVLQIGINPSGSYAELFNGGPSSFAIEARTARTKTGWTAEIMIPLRRLMQLYQESGSDMHQYLWNINICRHQPLASAENRYSCWSYTGSGFYSKDALGLLLVKPSYKNALSYLLESAQSSIGQITQANAIPVTGTENRNVRLVHESLGEIAAFASLMDAAVKGADVVPAYQFARYATEINALPQAVESNYTALKRLSVALPPECAERGFAFFSLPLVENIDESRFPAPDEIISSIFLRSARDEICAKHFAFFAQKEIRDITVTAGDLKGPAGIIEKGNVDIRIVQPWGENQRADILATDLRIPFNGWLEGYNEKQRFLPLVPANSCKHFLVDVTVASNQPAGTYHGTISFAVGDTVTRLPLTVEVLPFTLKRTKRNVGFFTRANLFDEHGPKRGTRGAQVNNGPLTEQSLYEDFHFIARSGFNFVHLQNLVSGVLNPDYTKKLLAISDRAGLQGVSLTGANWLITSAVVTNKSQLATNREILSEKLRSIAAVAKAYPSLEVAIYGFDEPVNDTHVMINNVIFEEARKYSFKTTVATCHDDIRIKMHGLTTPVLGWTGVTWSGKNELIDSLFRGEKLPYDKVTIYANFYNTYKPLVRLTFGWYLYKSHLGGNMPWALYDMDKNWEPFYNPKDGEPMYMDHQCASFVFPTRDRPIPTLKFVAARSGVNDLRYLETLESFLADAKDVSRKSRVQARLDVMLKRFALYNPKGIQSENFLITAKTYDDFQEELRGMIMDMLQ